MKFHQMYDHGCTDPDKCDFFLEIGSIVGISEDSDKVYKIVGFPNCGDMVEVREMSTISGNWREWTIIPDSPVISVIPQVVGLV